MSWTCKICKEKNGEYRQYCMYCLYKRSIMFPEEWLETKDDDTRN